jgi:hypothetical protein
MSIFKDTCFQARACDSARVIQVIETTAMRGDGKETVLRLVTQYWSLDSQLLAEKDPVPDGVVKK